MPLVPRGRTYSNYTRNIQDANAGIPESTIRSRRMRRQQVALGNEQRIEGIQNQVGFTHCQL